MSVFKKATKKESKLRLAIFGPSGGGKTKSALRIADGIVSKMGGRVAVIDSERGSASKYSNDHDFDVVEIGDEPTIANYCEMIKLANAENYSVIIIDSLSHGWQDLLAEVEQLAKLKYKGNTWSAWSEGTPKQKMLVDSILNSTHIIATMRSKTEWTTEKVNGKNRPVRVGLAPEQGKGIEYEFDMLMEINPEHYATIIKDRSGKYQDAEVHMPSEEFGGELYDWVTDGAKVTLKDSNPKMYDAFKKLGKEVYTPVLKKHGMKSLDDLANKSREIAGNIYNECNEAKV